MPPGTNKDWLTHHSYCFPFCLSLFCDYTLYKVLETGISCTGNRCFQLRMKHTIVLLLACMLLCIGNIFYIFHLVSYMCNKTIVLLSDLGSNTCVIKYLLFKFFYSCIFEYFQIILVPNKLHKLEVFESIFKKCPINILLFETILKFLFPNMWSQITLGPNRPGFKYF